MYCEITQGIQIEVTPEYLAEESSPEAAQYVFAYHIKITNMGQTEVQLLSRHWIITDGKGLVHEVKGPGVVGEQPRLKPGESHAYTSFCPLTTPTGNMRGSFQMTNDRGAMFDARIPLFFLRDTRAMH
ncbi:MAG: Co2+/Mg2+ efflux protein ApaG [Deltaproteobacteria bacterium]|nr:Co2+/Mg2+ efflux protein ApaG [Deltaproteobacteria bacterium]